MQISHPCHSVGMRYFQERQDFLEVQIPRLECTGYCPEMAGGNYEEILSLTLTSTIYSFISIKSSTRTIYSILISSFTTITLFKLLIDTLKIVKETLEHFNP